MYALLGHTILDTLEGYRSSRINKERSNFFFLGTFPHRDLFFFFISVFFLFFFFFPFFFFWNDVGHKLCGSHSSEDGWIGRLGSGRCGN